MIELLWLMLYRCWLICNIVWREDKSQNMICRHSWVYTHWFFCFLSHLCRWLKKKKINGTCILLAVNVNINPHQQLYNPAMISLKLKQIIRFVNRVEDWWCHPCRQFICKVSYIGCASQDWNNTRRDQKIKKQQKTQHLHVSICKSAPNPASPVLWAGSVPAPWDTAPCMQPEPALFSAVLGQLAKPWELPKTTPLGWYIGQWCP